MNSSKIGCSQTLPADSPNPKKSRQRGLIPVMRNSTLGVVGIAFLSIFLLLVGLEYLEYRRSLTDARNVLLERKRTHVMERVNEAVDGIDHMRHSSPLSQGRGGGEIQQAVKERIRTLTYDQGEGYFFLLSAEGRMLVHPMRPDLEGTNVLIDKDAHGFDFFPKLITAALQPEGGFLNYEWSRSGQEPPVPKLSYAKQIDEWDWIISTGIYLDDVDAALAEESVALQHRLLKRTGLILSVGIGALLLLAFIFHRMANRVAREIQILMAGASTLSTAELKQSFSILEFQTIADRAVVALQEIEISKQKFIKSFQNNVALMSISSLKDGRLIEVNEAFLQTLQYTEDEVIGKTSIELGILDEALRNKVIMNISQSGDTGMIEAQYRDRVGNVRDCEYRAQTIDLGTEKCLLSVIHDTTARKKADDMVLQLSRAIEQSPVSVVITDTQGGIEYVNPKFCEVTGYKPEEVSGENPRVLKSGETTDDRYQELWQAISEGGQWRGEFHNKRKDGTFFWEAATISGIRDVDGNVSHYLAVKEDITEKKELESQLLQAQKLESIGQLAAGIAHEINTPIQFVGDNLHFLQDSVGDLLDLADQHLALIECAESAGVDPALIAQQRKVLEVADMDYLKEELPNAITQSLEGTDRVAEIVRAMKNFSHPGSTKISCSNLNEAIETTIIVARNEWKYVATVETDLAGDLPAVPCMLGEFNQVVLNMIVNARDAIVESGQNGVISISTACEGNWAVVRISDTGVGMPEEVRGRIFEPFFTTKEVGKGTGQGLYIAHNMIVRKHNGEITVESAPGKGTTFVIKLPLENAGEVLVEDY